jgi:hypothetical protein
LSREWHPRPQPSSVIYCQQEDTMSIPGKIKSVIVGYPAPKEPALGPVVRGHY